MKFPPYRPLAATGASNGASPPSGCTHSGHVLCRLTDVGPVAIELEPTAPPRRAPTAQGLRFAQHIDRRAQLS